MENKNRWCKVCWNPVVEIPNAKRTIGRGTASYKYSHRIGSINLCDNVQLTEEQITDQDPMLTE